MKKIFVVSDIHGHCTLLKEALENAGFDKENENHLLVCCGDYFDRGVENLEVLKYFERLKHKVLLRGNHEELLLKLLQTGKVLPHNYLNGTMTTLGEFLGKYSINPVDDTIDFSGKTRMVDRVCEFIDETKNYFETENYVFAHGWLPSYGGFRSASDADWDRARWQAVIRLLPLSKVLSPKGVKRSQAPLILIPCAFAEKTAKSIRLTTNSL